MFQCSTVRVATVWLGLAVVTLTSPAAGGTRAVFPAIDDRVLIAQATDAPRQVAQAAVEALQDGVRLLRGGDFEAALTKFRDAEQAGADARVAFYLGVVLNRLRRPLEAMQRLAAAELAGVRVGTLDFEVGWAAVNLGQWRHAITRLRRYDRARPGNPKVAEFIGRAYAGLGNYGAAKVWLAEAVRRDPAVKPTVDYYLALIARAEGDDEAARAALERIRREAPDSPVAKALGAPPRQPWRIVVSAGGGYNDNVIGLGEGVVLPTDISDQASPFITATANGSYEWRVTDADSLVGSYAFRTDDYSKINSADLMDHTFSGAYRRRISRDLSVVFGGAGQYSLLDDHLFRNQYSLGPSVAYRPADWLITELAYTFSLSVYRGAFTEAQDRDSRTHGANLNAYFDVPDTKLQARLGASVVVNNSNGADFDFTSYTLSGSLSHPLVWGVTGEVSYTRSFDNYHDDNSLAGAAGFGFARDDNVDRLGVVVRRRVFNWLSLYARYDYSHVDSNITIYGYEQQVGSAGFVAEF